MRKFISLLVALSLLLALPASVSADSSCDPVRPHDDLIRYQFWGEYASAGYVPTAVGATMEYLQAYVGEGWNEFSASYIRIGQGGSGWIFFGYRRFNNVGVQNQILLEIAHPFPTTVIDLTATQPPILSDPAPDSFHDFQLVRDANGYWRAYYDSQLVMNIGTMSWTPTYVEIGNETSTGGNQLFGGRWDYADFNTLRYAVNNSNYIQYGSHSGFSEWFYNGWPENYAMQKDQQLWPGMDTWDWDCF